MDFDEYEYLEKAVEDPDLSSDKKEKDRKSRDDGSEKVERSHRKRDGDVDDRRSKHSRGDGDNRSSRDRDRRRGDRDRGRERSDRDAEKERGGERRDREKRRERDGELEKGRERERSSSRKREERQKELIREGERELEMRENRFKDKKEAAEPEADPERDQRTVFAYQITLKATERDVYDFFSKAGKVRDVRLIMDRNSRRSRGVGYIEFFEAMSVPMAIALSGQLLLGLPVMVKPSEAEKNLVQSTATTGTSGLTGPYGAVDRKLYVGNLHFSITETQLREIFEAFGPVELVQMPVDLETGQCKGFGFVQFSHLEHAKAAQTLNGKLEIAGRVVKVSSVSDHVGVMESGGKSADFDDEEGGGWSLNAQSRALLMQKLDRTGTAPSIAGSLGVPASNGAALNQQTFGLPINGQAAFPLPVLPTPVSEPVGNPSECLLLKNMFDPATEEEPDFDLDIKDDVGEECSKYGRVVHIYVDKNSAGFVYVRFETVQAAMAAQQAMHLRWFARRLISALFMLPSDYEAKFNSGA